MTLLAHRADNLPGDEMSLLYYLIHEVQPKVKVNGVIVTQRAAA